VSKYEPEGRIYRDLHQAKVCNIAEFITQLVTWAMCAERQRNSVTLFKIEDPVSITITVLFLAP
jgi:hypothetical protein